jgi:hypothetical protein
MHSMSDEDGGKNLTISFLPFFQIPGILGVDPGLNGVFSNLMYPCQIRTTGANNFIC